MTEQSSRSSWIPDSGDSRLPSRHDRGHPLRPSGTRPCPLFSASVAATIGLGLGVLCSAVTFLNAYVLKPVDLPDPYALYGLSWDTADVRRHAFTLADFEALRDNAPHFSSLAAGQQTRVMQGDNLMAGGLVTGNYFAMLGATLHWAGC